MGQRIFNLSKWRHIANGEGWTFRNPNRRMVCLDVNCADPVKFYAIQSVEDLEANPEHIQDQEAGRDGELNLIPKLSGDVAKAVQADDSDGKAVTFIGRALGRDRLEFGVEGKFELLAIGGEAWVYTHDSEDIALRIIDPVIFTKIANRRERNPELEWMNYQMRLNQDRMLQALESEIERRVGALERNEERYAERRVGRTPLGRPRIERTRTESEDDREEQEDRRRPGAAKAPKDQGGDGDDVPAKRKKVAAPPISK